MRYSIKLGSHWAIGFGDKNLKYRRNNLPTIFHIVRLISNCPQEKLLLSQSHQTQKHFFST